MNLIEESDACDAHAMIHVGVIRAGRELGHNLVASCRDLLGPPTPRRHELGIHTIRNDGLSSLALEDECVAATHLDLVRNDHRLKFVNGSLNFRRAAVITD